jgi:hypothetical protein
VARVLKNQLNSLLRQAMESISIPSIDPYLRIVQKLFNKISKNYEKIKDISWFNHFFDDCSEQFPFSNVISFSQCISQYFLFNRLCEITGVKVRILLPFLLFISYLA